MHIVCFTHTFRLRECIHVIKKNRNKAGDTKFGIVKLVMNADGQAKNGVPEMYELSLGLEVDQ